MKKVLLILSIIAALSSAAFTLNSANYAISAEVMNLGGASTTSSGHKLLSAIRENVPQLITSPSYTLESRFMGIVFGSGAFITIETPVVTSVSPNIGLNNASYRVVINGWFISSDATVSLTSLSHPTINGTTVTIESSTSLECTFDVNGEDAGARNVTVTNTGYNKSGSLAGGFTVTAPGKVDIIGKAVNTPNPFNPSTGPTTISYKLNVPATINLYLFNQKGQIIWRKVIPSGQNGGAAGNNAVTWEATSMFNEDVPTGVYILSIVSNSGGASKELRRVKIAVIRQ